MSRNSLKQYQSHLSATGRAPKAPIDVTGCAPRRVLRTVPPPAPEELTLDLLKRAAQLEADASVLLAHAADLKRSAGRDPLKPAAWLLNERE